MPKFWHLNLKQQKLIISQFTWPSLCNQEVSLALLRTWLDIFLNSHSSSTGRKCTTSTQFKHLKIIIQRSQAEKRRKSEGGGREIEGRRVGEERREIEREALYTTKHTLCSGSWQLLRSSLTSVYTSQNSTKLVVYRTTLWVGLGSECGFLLTKTLVSQTNGDAWLT